MTLTGDQLRAARMLLRLQKDRSAELSGVGIATIRCFETESGIRPTQVASLRRALEKAEATLRDGGGSIEVALSTGVALRAQSASGMDAV